MNKSQLAILTDAERMLVLETTSEAMADLDEDAVAALHDRPPGAQQVHRAVPARCCRAGVHGGGSR